jgi:hypothetical protein
MPFSSFFSLEMRKSIKIAKKRQKKAFSVKPYIQL